MLQEQEINNLIKKLKRISTLSIILGVIVILVVIYMRGVLGYISIRMNGSLDADILIVAITWGLITLGVTLITLGIKTRKATLKRARTYSLISILIAWALFLFTFFTGAVLGITPGLIIWVFVIYLIISHVNLKAADKLLKLNDNNLNNT